MLYHYYMKINTNILAALLLVLALFPALTAQITVVKQDGQKVYLDTSDYNRTLAVGDSFKIITSQEKLTNPKTGKNLGLINHYSANGKIIEVQSLYAIGEMPDKTKFTIGQEAVIDFARPAAQVAKHTATTATYAQETATASATPATLPNRKIKTYAAVEREIISALQADLTAFPGEEIAALDTKGNVILYTADGAALTELATFKLPVTWDPITLSAQDITGTGYAQLFVVSYKEKEQKINTFVFDVQDKEFKQVAQLPYFVKELGCDSDKKLYAQKPFIRSTKPGEAHALAYENGRFQLTKDAFSTRNNWLTGIAKYPIQDKETENLVYTASNGRLKLQLANGKFTESPALFATGPNRVKYKQAILTFYPALQVYGPQGRATLAGIENTSKLGLLSAQFGQYNGGKIHFLKYENGSLRVEESIDLDGFAYDTSCTSRGILIPQVLPSGQTVLTEIYR